jgi:uncharacterized membrane protein YbhN (UPF0104 family)
MATVHRIPPTPDLDHDEGLVGRLTRLLKLEMELGLAETRLLLRRVAVALAVAVLSIITLVASLVVLLVAVFAPLFDAAWEHFVIAGGAGLLLAVIGLAWTAWRLKRLQWPRQTLASFEENWRWLAAQLRSRLTLQ